MFVPIGSEQDFPSDYTLLLPAISVGNVGQLAIDLIISTLKIPKVGYFYTDCLVPMVGSNPYETDEENAKELCTNAEVYALPSQKLAVLQLRSLVIKKKSKSFRQALVSWIKRCAFARVILLSSCHAYHRDDTQLFGTPFRYLVTPALQKSVADVLKELEWKEMEKVSSYPGLNDNEKRVFIPGGGFTKRFYDDCCLEDLQMAVVLKFCSEGDNVPDAFSLLNQVNEWLHLVASTNGDVLAKWKAPGSWQLLFGSGLPAAIF
ncbi:proteasome assembly chaperone 2 [Xenopus tropicalis]|uniref:Proteasome assembly chaperone 2 n=1 Tax=Xenopus tropicalis TaxID=8364 RepID=PSMG2_XENTR|nr:proteasome assembly chaperone 2 [Xenopus tropicalis]Q5XGC5.1 RecName: Full=Proteasome assembly chaperone 2 [Xenopus tropicalis]AAH84517.1 tumor necrosis factor superfamily, member 5-induced protein 1 [Xenopus tropicalis]|eukprot:NP_001011145.1 proteasome assembly chaperone 2 [Xenopus tropicalis]